MKVFKIILIVLLIAVSALYALDTVSASLSGDDIGPTISCPEEVLQISVTDPSDALLTGVTAYDEQDGDLTGRIRILGISKFIAERTAKVTYAVFDSDNNMATCTRELYYTDYTSPVFTVTTPLIYGQNASIALLDRICVTDCIDGDITQSVRVSTMHGTSDPEVYTVDIQVTNSMGDTAQITLPLIQQESSLNRATVNLTTTLTYITAGSTFDARSYLATVSTPTGYGFLSDVEITGTVDPSTPGTYMVFYTYRDEICTGTSILTVVVQ